MTSNRKRQIMKEATKIVSTHGLNSLTMSLLAKNVGVTEGAIYRHFSCKNELIKEILNDIFIETTNQIIEVTSQNLSSTDKLDLILRNQLSSFTKHPSEANILFSDEYFLTNRDTKILIYSIINTVQLYLQEIFEEGKIKGEFKSSLEARHTSMMFLGMIRMLVLNWELSDYQWDLSAYGSNYYKSFLSMIQLKK